MIISVFCESKLNCLKRKLCGCGSQRLLLFPTFFSNSYLSAGAVFLAAVPLPFTNNLRGEEDMRGTAQGRNKPIVKGQVGIRCRHCALLPGACRPRGAVYFTSFLGK